MVLYLCESIWIRLKTQISVINMYTIFSKKQPCVRDLIPFIRLKYRKIIQHQSILLRKKVDGPLFIRKLLIMALKSIYWLDIEIIKSKPKSCNILQILMESFRITLNWAKLDYATAMSENSCKLSKNCAIDFILLRHR